MGDEHAGKAIDVCAQAVDGRQQTFARGEVEARCWLVEQQQRRAWHQCPRDQRATPLALAHHRPLGVASSTHTQHLEQVVGVAMLVVGVDVATVELRGVGQSGQHDVVRGDRHVDAPARVDVTDVSSQLPHVDPTEPTAQHVNGSGGGVAARAQDRHQRRLTRPVRSQQRPVLTRRDREVDVVQ